MKHEWIFNWDNLCQEQLYLICTLDKNSEGTYYIGQMVGRDTGAFVKRKWKQGCYVAAPIPSIPTHEEIKEALR